MITAKLEEALRFISRFALLNLVWIGFTAAGLGILGLFPATYALFVTVQQWIRSREESPFVKPFFKVYKASFVRANAVGWVLVLIGGLLYLNFRLIEGAAGTTPLPVVIAFLIIVFIYGLVLVTIYPVWVYYQGGVRNTFINTLRFIFGRLHVAVLFGAVVWGTIYLSLSFPAFIVFFSGSVLAYILMWFFNRTIERLKMKQHA
ncbi:YesL family protein [Alteribacter lacisalsi]|nr:DUF624 domain-containing protein [Alteribacter lacisalsi]